MVLQHLVFALLAVAPGSPKPASELPPTAATALQICRKSENGLPALLRSTACELVLAAPSADRTERTAAHLGRALALREMGERPRALDQLDQALILSPDDVLVLLTRGDMRHETDDVDGAFDDYNRAARMAPSDPRPRQGRVDILMDRGCYSEAIADFDLLLKGAEEPGLYFNGRGVARLRLVDRTRPFTGTATFDRILADFDRAVETLHGTDRAAAHYNRAELRLDTQRWQAAREDYDQALALRPNTVRYLLGRARAKRGAGDLDGARADYDRIAMLPSVDTWTKEAKNERRAIAIPGEADSFLRTTYLTVLSASAEIDGAQGRPMLKVRLDESSRQRLADLTTDNVGATLDVIVDGQLVTSPVIREPITLGFLQLLSDGPVDEIHRLARRLVQPNVRIMVRLAPSAERP